MRTNLVTQARRILTATLLLLFLSGCVVIPTRAPVRQFQDPAISFLAPGMTTQADVRRILGPPVVTTLDNTRWIYHERGMSREYIMFVGWSPAQIEATPVEYFLLLDFDVAGVLAGYNVEKNGTSCGDGICVARGKYYSIEARENHPVAETGEISGDHCSVYVFADRPRIGAWIGGDSVEAVLDGEQIGYLLDDDTYFHLVVGSGSHRLQSQYIMNVYGMDALPKRIRSEKTLETQQVSFDCQNGEPHYFEHVTDRKTGTRLQVHSDDEGASEIAKRNVLQRLVYSSLPAGSEEPAR